MTPTQRVVLITHAVNFTQRYRREPSGQIRRNQSVLVQYENAVAFARLI